MQRPAPTAGLRHAALFVEDLAACERFYGELLGMRVEWRPDADSVCLTSGNDTLALHRWPAGVVPTGTQRRGHIGFILATTADVDAWTALLLAQGMTIKNATRT